jgi:hypothetical protein
MLLFNYLSALLMRFINFHPFMAMFVLGDFQSAPSCACLTMQFPPEQMMCCTHLAGLQSHSTQCQEGISRQESKVMCLHIMVGPGCPRFLQNSFCSSLHCDFAFPGEEKRSLKKKKKVGGKRLFSGLPGICCWSQGLGF